jgi:catabolite regulation protein CreA
MTTNISVFQSMKLATVDIVVVGSGDPAVTGTACYRFGAASMNKAVERSGCASWRNGVRCTPGA